MPVATPPGPRRRYPGEFALAVVRRPLHFLPALARDFGDVAAFGIASQPLVLLSHPDQIRDVLVTHGRRFHKGRGLERAKIEQEYLEVIQLIEQLRSILSSPQKMLEIIKDEVRRLRDKFGDDRRTQIAVEEGDIGYEDTIEQKVMALKAAKGALFDSVMRDGAFGSATLNAADIRSLLE